MKHALGSVRGRALLLVIGVMLLAFAAAGCGGSKAPSVASLGTTSAGTATSTSGAGAAKASQSSFATCMTSHGFAATIGSAANASSGTISIAGVMFNGVDPNSPQFQSAMQACHTLLPGGGPPALTPAQQAEQAKALASFAACMRKHGVASFPDPNGQGKFPFGSLQQLNMSSTLFQTANKACESLLSKGAGRIRFG